MVENNLTWTYFPEDDAWECGLCGLYWIICNDHTPKENGINFCPQCGIKIKRFINEGRRGVICPNT